MAGVNTQVKPPFEVLSATSGATSMATSMISSGKIDEVFLQDKDANTVANSKMQVLNLTAIIEKALSAKINELSTSIHSQFSTLDNSISLKLTQIESKVDSSKTAIDNLTHSLEFTQSEVDTLKTDMSKVKNQVDELIVSKPSMDKKMADFEAKVSILENHQSANHDRAVKSAAAIEELRMQNRYLRDKMEKGENYSRKTNIIIDGISEGDPQSDYEKVKSVFQKLEMDMPDIVDFHRLGSKKRLVRGKGRPIMIRLVRTLDKIEVFKRASKLKGTDLYIREDVCRETQLKRAPLVPFLKLARRYDKKARFIEDKLLFKGELFDSNNIAKLPLSMDEVGCRRAKGVTLFQGESCPLSNLYMSEITIEGVTYASNEHFYQYQKCSELGAEDLAKAVLEAKTGRNAMFIGQKLRPPNDWAYESGANIMKIGVAAKFEKEELKDYLLATVGIIGEATKGRKWGIGWGLHSQEAVSIDKWTGSNLMGGILTDLRDQLLLAESQGNHP